MTTYLVSYDLTVPGKNYERLWEALRGLNAVRVLDSQWTLNHDNTTPVLLGNHLVHFMDNNDRILVTRMPDDYAHRNLIA